jgi:XisI protein
MERVIDLTAIVEREMANYVWDQEDSKAYLMKNESHQVYAVLIIPVDNPQHSQTVIVAQIEGNKVVIDTDLTDKPLYKALLQAGVPEGQIVRAYAQRRNSSTKA